MSGIQALNLAADVHPTPAQINACEAKAKTAFGEAGGDVDSFEREKQEGAATAVGDTMKACVKTALESKTSPTREDYDTAHKSCDAKAMKAFTQAGGDQKEFQVAKLEGSRAKMMDAVAACVKGLGLADGVQPSAQQRSDCDVDAKKIFQEAGGDQEDFQYQKRKAATATIYNRMEACECSTGDFVSAHACAHGLFSFEDGARTHTRPFACVCVVCAFV
jgi:hypothetical protein